MKVMIMAAECGHSLCSLTNTTPKALVEINGQPMLDRVIKQVVNYGATDVVINTSYLAEKIEAFLENADYDIPIHTVYEKDPLETAGALSNVRNLLQSDEPVIVHNVDIFSNINIRSLFNDQQRSSTLATLATRKTVHDTRPLLVDRFGNIVGHRNKTEKTEIVQPQTDTLFVQEHLFCGIHAVSQKFLDILLTHKTKGVSLTSIYLKLIMQGQIVKSHNIGDSLWLDIGTIESKNQAEAWAVHKL